MNCGRHCVSATIACEITPVCCGSSYKNKGVQLVLDAVVDYMPSPLDVPPITGVHPSTGKEDQRPSDDNAPFSALAFKIMTDPFVGKLCFFRVYSGSLKAGTYAYNSVKKKRERISRILQMHSITARKSVRFLPAISLLPWVSGTRQPAIPCAMKSIR